MENTNSHPVEAIAYTRFFRLLRPLAYSNEVGESFRYKFPKVLPYAYGLAGVYVLGDITRQVYFETPQNRTKRAIDAGIFHLSASVLLPTATVATVVHTAKLLTRSIHNPHLKLWLPVLAGIGSIPLIIGPIDHATEHAMDLYIRKFIW